MGSHTEAPPLLMMTPDAVDASLVALQAPRLYAGAGLTVRDVARRYRVGQDKVRRWIARGELAAVNTAAILCGRPRWVIPPEAIVQFEKGLRGCPAPGPRRRQQKGAHEVDFYPG